MEGTRSTDTLRRCIRSRATQLSSRRAPIRLCSSNCVTPLILLPATSLFALSIRPSVTLLQELARPALAAICCMRATLPRWRRRRTLEQPRWCRSADRLHPPRRNRKPRTARRRSPTSPSRNRALRWNEGDQRCGCLHSRSRRVARSKRGLGRIGGALGGQSFRIGRARAERHRCHRQRCFRSAPPDRSAGRESRRRRSSARNVRADAGTRSDRLAHAAARRSYQSEHRISAHAHRRLWTPAGRPRPRQGGQRLRIVRVDGLTLEVEPETPPKGSQPCS
jgi:hypothetical protein